MHENSADLFLRQNNNYNYAKQNVQPAAPSFDSDDTLG